MWVSGYRRRYHYSLQNSCAILLESLRLLSHAGRYRSPQRLLSLPILVQGTTDCEFHSCLGSIDVYWFRIWISMSDVTKSSKRSNAATRERRTNCFLLFIQELRRLAAHKMAGDLQATHFSQRPWCMRPFFAFGRTGSSAAVGRSRHFFAAAARGDAAHSGGSARKKKR